MALNILYTIVLLSICVAHSAVDGRDRTPRAQLQCYTCTSIKNNKCGDPFNNVTMGSALTNCNDFLKKNASNYEHLEHYWRLDGYTADDAPTFCRKIIQEVEDDKRISRECAYLADHKILEREENERCIPRAGTYHIKYVTCYCDTTGCNSAPAPAGITFSSGLILALVTLVPILLVK